MPLSACKRCGKLFMKSSELSICSTCIPEEEADFEKVRNLLDTTPDLTSEEVSQATAVSLDCVLRLIEAGRIRLVTPDTQVRCGRCGAPAISMSKKLCEACLNKLNQELAEQQSKIRLPKKKRLQIGRAQGLAQAESRRTSRSLDFRKRSKK